jgi:hypothetical protein
VPERLPIPEPILKAVKPLDYSLEDAPQSFAALLLSNAVRLRLTDCSGLIFRGYAARPTFATESYQYQPTTAHHPAAACSKSSHLRIDSLQPAQPVPILQDFDVCSAHVA